MAASSGENLAGKGRGSRTRNDKAHSNSQINSKLTKKELQQEMTSRKSRALALAVVWCESKKLGAKACIKYYAALNDRTSKDYDSKHPDLPGLPKTMRRTLQRELSQRWMLCCADK